MANTTAPITTPTAIFMTKTVIDAAALARLLAWASPAYPVGGFSYSHGLETAVEEGVVTSRADLVAYITTALHQGAGAVDGGLLALAWRAAEAGDEAHLDEITELAAAWRGSQELALEATQPGGAFVSVTVRAWPEPRLAAYQARHAGRLTHAVAFGAAAAWQGIPLPSACFSWLSAFAAGIVSAGVRLIPLGQSDGQIATADLVPAIIDATDAALAVVSADDLGTAALMLDHYAMRHETQYTRLFRS